MFVQWGERPFVELLARHVHGPDGPRRAAGDGRLYQRRCFRARAAPTWRRSSAILSRAASIRSAEPAAFSEALAEALAESGGEIAYKTAGPENSDRKRPRRRPAAGERRDHPRARRVANSDPRKTFLDLIDPEHLPAGFREKIAAAPPAVSGFAVHLGVAGEWDGQPLTFVAGDPDILIARPGLVDPGDAPHGYAAIDILTLLPHDKAKDWFPPGGGPSTGANGGARRIICAARRRSPTP